MSTGQLPPKPLRAVNRIITTHDASGKPTFDTGIKEGIDWDRTPLGGDMFLTYTGTQFPVPLAGDADLATYREHLVNHPAFMIPGGFVARYVDYHPGAPPHWHRTMTVDFAVVVEGEILLELEGGETRTLKRGDVAVQRGTNHAWSNPSPTEYARVFYIALAADPPVVNGQELGESLGQVSH